MTKFILGFHCHQPVGNFDFIFEEVHKKSYSPLIRTLTAFNIKFSLHVSGVLLEWWKKNDPELIKTVAEGVEKGNLELIGGGYYEPVLASIPREDRLRQLEMLIAALKKLFGKEPSGTWITERIWQPDIVKDLKEAGLNFAFLDDFQFFQAGISEDAIDNIFRTEYEGEYFDIFPIHERLRYKIPFAEPRESLNEVLRLNGRLSSLSVMFDDGEKMGGWPGTYDWVYGKNGKKGWLENFICEAGSSGEYSGISFKLPSEILKEGLNTSPSRVQAYLPMSSYREMGEWTLQAEKRLDYETAKEKCPSAPLSGGIWHNFLIRYPEANLQHKRMLNLSGKINHSAKMEISRNRYNNESRDAHLLENALGELLKSQANDAYWHGVFGGIYLPHLRRGVHNALLSSYILYKESAGKQLEIEYYDFDADGEKEILLSNHYWCVIYKPGFGVFLSLDCVEKGLINSLGDVFCLHNEFDILKLKENRYFKNDSGGNGKECGAGNPPDTIHKEAKYPPDLSEKDLIVYRGLLPPFEILFNGSQVRYTGEPVIKEDARKNVIKLKAGGFLDVNSNCGGGLNASACDISVNIKIEKNIKFFINSKPKTKGTMDVIFRFAFPGGDGPATSADIAGDIKGLNGSFKKEMKTGVKNSVSLVDSFWGGKINLKELASSKFIKKYDIGLEPITTISLSENGYERIFQGVELKYGFNLPPESDFRSIISIDVEKVKR